MNIPKWLKPALQGAAVGAIALAITGFTWGGWVTGGTAKEMAADQAKLEVLAALVPICIEQSSQDPKVTETLALMKDAYFGERKDMVVKAGWATMPGSSDPSRYVARACMVSTYRNDAANARYLSVLSVSRQVLPIDSRGLEAALEADA
jgi:hypothetical protein